METLFIIKENTIEINNLKKLITFSNQEFKIKIKDQVYIIGGNNMEILEIDQEAEKLVITGQFNSLAKVGKQSKDNTSFLKKIFS